MISNKLRMICCGALLCLGAGITYQPAVAQTQADLLLVGGILVDVRGDSLVGEVSIGIRGQDIEAVSIAGTEFQTRYRDTVDISGTFVIPGLIDGHVHQPLCAWVVEDAERLGVCAGKLVDGPLFLRHGVTTIMHMSGRVEFNDDELAHPHGTRPDPSVVNVTRSLSSIGDSAAIIAFITEEVAAGRYLIKTHGFLGASAALGAYEAANRLGATVIGHVEPDIGIVEAVENGHVIAHAYQFYEAHLDPRGAGQSALRTGVPLMTVVLLGLALSVGRRKRAGAWGHWVGIAGGILVGGGYRLGSWMSGEAGWLLMVLGLVLVVSSFAMQAKFIAGQSEGREYGIPGGLVIGLLLLSTIPIVPRLIRATDAGVGSIAAVAADSEVPISPTLTNRKNLAEFPMETAYSGFLEAAEANRLAPEVVENWADDEVYRNHGFLSGIKNYMLAKSSANQYLVLERYTSALISQRATLFAGTSLGVPGTIPGLSMIEELETLEKLGMTPAGALEAATRNAAEVARESELIGVVKSGFRADIVILERNPLESTSNLRSIRAVVVRGRIWSVEALDSLLSAQDSIRRGL